MMLAGWGGFPRQDCRVSRPRSEEDLRALVAEGDLIARGNGRAYGDSAMGEGITADMRGFNRMIAFDAETGRLVVEAGVLLSDVIDVFLPRGWFPAITPGTKLVTIGGMIAADVHGKNHQEGSFGAFTDWIDLMGADGRVVRCSRDQNADLFGWTIGGMGLTGVILRAAIRLRPVESAWIRQTTIAAPTLDATMAALADSDRATYSVSWIDVLSTGRALGRSIVTLGEHAARAELPADRRANPYATPRRRKLAVPFYAPSFTINGLSVRIFNALYYAKGALAAGEALVDWDTYFYPLDSVTGWNRIYGRKGFMQFQCALPTESARAGLEAQLRAISKAGIGSFLTVLKRLGPQAGQFSFPMEGYTLAVDFPVSRGSHVLMAELDRITIDHGGRFYLAKDSRISAEVLRQADPRVERFVQMRLKEQRSRAFVSGQSRRLGI